MSTLSKTLRSLGLNEKEAQAYLALLAAGSVSASTLGARISMPKSTARYLCRELAKKGLVSYSRKGAVFFYVAEPPEKLISGLEREKRKIEQKQEAAQRIMTELKTIARPESALPRVRFYEGLEGLAEAYHAVLLDVPEGGEITSFLRPIYPEERHLPSDVSNEELLTILLMRFVQERVGKRISIRTLALPSEASSSWRARDGAELRETRFLPEFPLAGSPVEILLYGERMCSISARHGMLFCYVIEDAGITAVHRAVFEAAWAAAGAS